MSLIRAAVEWPQVVTAVIAMAAFGLSILSLFLQRRRPYLEGQFLTVRPHAAVAIRNTGNLTARAPWAMFATKDGEASFCGHVGPGFLAPESGRLVITDAAFPDAPTAVGVVGFINRKGVHVVRAFGDGVRPKHKRFKPGVSFEEIFRSFYPEQGLGEQAGKRSDEAID
jgi:hypothetical protein